MIRFVRFQEPDEEMFAFYDTVRDNFLTFNGVQGFSEFREISDCYQAPSEHDSCFIELERLRGLLDTAQKIKESANNVGATKYKSALHETKEDSARNSAMLEISLCLKELCRQEAHDNVQIRGELIGRLDVVLAQLQQQREP